ncbi:MAG: septum formation initiator family protein [Treponema sp.]|jgi:cell division protein FtsB|nr:septum formation initiator family protein [Treponema sp.]
MKLGKYILVPWFSLVVYTVLTVYYGPGGIIPYRELLGEHQKILENMEKLQAINQDLEGSRDALRYDSETIRIKAREIGYGIDGERFVRIVGLYGGRAGELKPGMIRTAIMPLPSGKSYRAIAFLMGSILFALFLLGDVLLKKDPDRDYLQDQD